MSKVYLRWRKEGNVLCARWFKKEARDITVQEPDGIWRVAFTEGDKTISKLSGGDGNPIRSSNSSF